MYDINNVTTNNVLAYSFDTNSLGTYNTYSFDTILLEALLRRDGLWLE